MSNASGGPEPVIFNFISVKEWLATDQREKRVSDYRFTSHCNSQSSDSQL